MLAETATATEEFPFAPDYTKPRPPTAAERFQTFHAANPHVLRAIIAKALQLQGAGHAFYGMKEICGVIRYEHAIQTVSDDGLKLNNNYTPFYARLAMKTEPALDGFFELRTQKDKGGNNGQS